MRAVVLAKQVPDRNSAFRSDGAWIDESSLGYNLNDYDRYAVEAALALKDAGHVEATTVVTAGPPDASQALRTCLAMGVDDGVHLLCPREALADPFAVADAIAAEVKALAPGVVLSGLLAEDSGHGQVGGLVAGLLGYAWASAVTCLRWTEGGLEVERELEGGRMARVALRLPAVVGLQTGANTPRYATLRGVMASRRKPVRRMTPPALQGPPDDAAGLVSVALRKPERMASAEILSGPPREAAAALVDRIRTGAGIRMDGGRS